MFRDSRCVASAVYEGPAKGTGKHTTSQVPRVIVRNGRWRLLAAALSQPLAGPPNEDLRVKWSPRFPKGG
jgi:hypothetical protein